MTISQKLVEKLVQKQFAVAPSKVKRIKMGVMNFNFTFSIDAIDYIIRISPNGIKSKLDFEFDVMFTLYKYKCKVPKPIIVSSLSGYSFLIYEALPGTPLSLLTDSQKNKKSLAKPIVENIINISRLKKSELTRKSMLTLYNKDWREYLFKIIENGKHYLRKNKKLNQSDIELTYQFLINTFPTFKSAKNKFIWSDISQDNIIIVDDNLSGFIDFEGCFFGDPILPLGYLFAIEGNSTFFKNIANEYAKYYSFTKKTIYFYAIWRIYRLAPYLNLPLPAGKKRDPIDRYFKGFRIAISQIK